MEQPVVYTEEYVGKLPVKECNDPLVNLLDYCPDIILELDKDNTVDGIPKGVCYVRREVAIRLARAQGDLSKYGYSLVIDGGYRSEKLQKAIWDKYYNLLHEKHPEWSDEKLLEEINKFVSPVGPGYIGSHCTGGAVDISLRKNGEKASLGGAPEDEEEITERASLKYENLSLEEKENREILTRTMRRHGFNPYPLEIWHWSYGDPYWSAYTGNVTKYGSIKSIEDARERGLLKEKMSFADFLSYSLNELIYKSLGQRMFYKLHDSLFGP